MIKNYFNKSTNLMKKITFTSYVLVLLGVLTVGSLYGQTNVNMPYNSGATTQTIAPPGTCSFNFYDNGGANGNYSSSSSPVTSILTFAPSNSGTHRIRATFTSMTVETNWDALYIYNGNVAETPSITVGNGVQPNQFNSGAAQGFTFRAGGFNSSFSAVTASPFTSTAASGALTFQFDSDSSVAQAGWVASVAQLPLVACGMTAPPDLVVSTGQFNCLADGTTPLPTFNPGGCQQALTLRYSVDGNTPVVVPQPLPANIPLVGLTSGPHVVLWTLVDPCGNVVVSSASQNVSVQDLVPPVITCPQNIVITLAPGACDAIVGYTIGVTDNCPFFVQGPAYQYPISFSAHGGGTAYTLSGNTAPGGVYFNVTNDSPGPLSVTGFGVRYGNPAFGVVNAPQTMQVYVTIGNTFVGVETNAGAWQNIGPAVANPIPPYFATGTGALAQLDLTQDILLNPGSSKGFHIYGQTACVVFNYFNNTAPVTNGPFTVRGGPVSFGLLSNLFQAGAASMPNIQVNSAITSDPTPNQYAGLPSGSVFPLGTTTNCFEVADVVGNTSTCCFDVVINEYPTPTTTLACNDNIQVSVNENCEGYVTTDMILEGGPYGCYDNYIVAIQGFGEGFGGVTIDNDAIGQTLTVTVTDPSTGNSCWGTISVEDKIKPTIECRDVVIMCGAQLPDNPAPQIVGYQNLVITGLNDLLDNNVYEYEFDYSYLPSTPVLDVDVRIKIDDHTWLPDVNINVESPDGTIIEVFDVGGCFGQEFPINCVFDDAGAAITQCVDLNAGDDGRLMPLIQGGFSMPALFGFNNLDASGVWKVIINDAFAGDDGHIREVGLYINVNLPQIDPADNCGEVDVTYTDTESGDPCDGLVVTRHWVVTDESGNTAACDQNITVEPLVLDSITCPPAYVGSCGDSSHPDNTGWPTVNGNEITDEDNVCNIFVGYWDKQLNDCGNGEKIVRTWTVLDWCTQTTAECIQVIKLSDNQAPVLTCPANLKVGTDFWYCYANVSVPKPGVVDICGSAYTLSLTSSAGVVVNSGNNYFINNLPVGVHTVTWRATDECGNKSSCSFTIEVEDDVVPVANCDSHTTVSLTNDGPYGITLVPAHVFDDGSYDNCGPVTFRVRRTDNSCIDFDWTTEGACIDDKPGGIPPVNSRDKGTVLRPCVPFACCDVGAGPIMVELEVEDLAGNKNFCMVEVTVQDKISPKLYCPPNDIIVSCDFWFNVEEGTFVDADGNDNGNLDEDPLSSVFGNMYDAFQYNDDQSVRQNVIITDPGNGNQPVNWGLEGWADDNCEVNLSVRVRVIDDCSGGDLPGTAPDGAVKYIERRFSATDGNVGVAPGTCTQRIWVVDFKPFFIQDVNCNNQNSQDGVIWPCDKLLTTCPEDLGDTGQPTVFDDACSVIGVTYSDTRFNFVDGACFKILRKWSVIDWCQYNSQTGAGLWNYTQVIKVLDEDGPAFVAPCETVVLCVEDEGVSLPANNQAFLGEEDPLSSSCSVHLNLSRVVHETCSDIVKYDVKIYPFNGTEYVVVKSTTTAVVDSNNDATLTFDTRQVTTNPIIRRDGIPYNSQFCGDYHRILWSVEDGCGNWSHCEYLFRLEDCKKPSPVCINGLSTVVMPVGGQVTVWAKDFNASSFDDCTPAAGLLYSFSGDTYQPSYTYNCDNVPAFGVELSTQVWVADGGTDDNCNGIISWGERNKDYCTTTIVITDNAGVCDTSGGSILAGEVLTEDVQTVELVGVSLNAPGHVFPTYVTTTNGQYNFNNLVLPSEFEVNAERNDNHRNGVSTLDLVKIQKHLLGIEAINSPYDLIAADANNSQTVSAIDLIELRKLILGLYTQLPANQSWRFVDKDFQFADPTSPWPFVESINMSALNGNAMGKDFVAIKVGDVNNTVQANALQILPRNGNGVVSLVAEDRSVEVGEMVSVEVRSSDFASIEGYQFTMEANGLEFRGVEAGVVDMKAENMGVFGSTLTASWHKVGGINATSTDVLFTLNFEAGVAGKLSQMMSINSKVTQAEAYNTSSDIKDLKLTFRGSEDGAFALYQNEPNPFAGVTTIGFDLPVATDVTLSIFDITGKVIVVKEQKSVKGYNTIQVSSKDIPSVGVLYYRLDANEYTATKKMIIIE